jgi:hypothetical protein
MNLGKIGANNCGHFKPELTHVEQPIPPHTPPTSPGLFRQSRKLVDSSEYIGLVNIYGSYIYPNGAKYEGHWINGKRDGYGIFISPGGQ